MITYTTGTYRDLIIPIFEDFLVFVRRNLDIDVSQTEAVLEIYKKDDQDVRVVLAKEGENLVGFYFWRPFIKSPYLKNNPKLGEELLAKGFSIEGLYNPLLLSVDHDYRRQGITSQMEDVAQQEASKEGFTGRVIYLIKSPTILNYKNSRYTDQVTLLDYRDAFGDSIEVYSFAQ